MKKRLIFVTKALWIGGIETALVTLLNHLDYEKFDVTLFVYRAELNMADRIDSRCRLIIVDRDKTFSFKTSYRYKKLFHMTEQTPNPSRLHRRLMWTVPFIKWIENRLYINYIHNLMKDERYDTCIIYSDVAAETAIRGINADKYLMFYHHGAMRRVYHDSIGYRRSEHIIAVSDNLKQKLQDFLPLYADKIVSIPNLSDVKKISEMSKENPSAYFNPALFHIVTVGRISPEKGMDLAVSACQQIVYKGYTNFHWWIVGGGPAYHDLEEQVTCLGMNSYISLVGMQSNPYPYILNADLYVQPSRVESFGLTIKEAITLKKIIVSTDTDGAREIMTGKNCGILCQINSENLAAAVCFYLEHPDLTKSNVDYCEVFEEENRVLINRFSQYL